MLSACSELQMSGQEEVEVFVNLRYLYFNDPLVW